MRRTNVVIVEIFSTKKTEKNCTFGTPKTAMNAEVNYRNKKLPIFRIFLLRNAPAGNHQAVAEDLVEDGSACRIINISLITQARMSTTINIMS
jgi:hypothetical protein